MVTEADQEELPRVALWEPNPGGGWRWADDLEYTKLDAERRYLAEGDWSIEGPFNPRILQDRLVTIDYCGRNFLTGTVEPAPSRQRDTPTLREDTSGSGVLALLGGVTMWPAPTLGIGGQPGPSGGYYTIAASPAEDAIRTMVADHYRDRYGADVTVPASLHRGGTVRVHTHMGDLLDIAVAKARRGGIGFELQLVKTAGTRANLTLVFYVPTTLSAWAKLSDGDGTLRAWSQNTPAPTCNRAIVWGAGDVYKVVEDAASIAAWGRAYEQLVEAQDTFDPDTLLERGHEALDQGATSASFQLEAAEADGMRWGEHYDVGDRLLVELADDVAFTEPISAVSLSVEDGVTITPIVGDPDGNDGEFTQAKLISQLRASVRKQETRRSS